MLTQTVADNIRSADIRHSTRRFAQADVDILIAERQPLGPGPLAFLGRLGGPGWLISSGPQEPTGRHINNHGRTLSVGLNSDDTALNRRQWQPDRPVSDDSSGIREGVNQQHALAARVAHENRSQSPGGGRFMVREVGRQRVIDSGRKVGARLFHPLLQSLGPQNRRPPQQTRQGTAKLAPVKLISADRCFAVPADRLCLLAGHSLNEKWGEIVGRLQVGVAFPLFSHLKELRKCHKPAQHRGKLRHPSQVVEPR